MPDPSDVGAAATPLRVVLMGTGPFAVPSFEAIRAAGHDVAAVVTRPERPGPGRRPPTPSPVRQWADSHRVPVQAPESINSPGAIKMVASLRADLLVVCDYGQILKPDALATARLGGINLHGSLLPAYRGAAPVQWAVLTGESESGVSVIHMTPKLDAGPVIVTRRTAIGEKETAGELETRLAQLGVDATLEAIERLATLARASTERDSDNDSGPPVLAGQPQDPQQASRAPRLSKADGRIVWTRPAEELQWHVRGMQPWPGAFTEVPAESGRRGAQPLRLTILDVDAIDSPVAPEIEPGTVEIEGGELHVAAGDRWLRINRLKPAGRREMATDEWLRGRPIEPGMVLR